MQYQSYKCLSVASSPSSVSTNVWARELAADHHVVVFFNLGRAVADVVCNEACFAAAGVAKDT